MQDNQTLSLSKQTMPQSYLLFVTGFFLVIGSILRLIWTADMEWKGDEIWMWEHTQQILSGEIDLSWVGMRTSLEVPNFAFGNLIFVTLAKISDTPVTMVRWIQCLNVVTLWGFFYFIYRWIRTSERQTWLWGLAIASVNPAAILLARKLWLPDLIAPFCLLILIGHRFRHRFWGSLLWSSSAMLLGQIHFGGFFVVIGLGGWTMWQDYRHKTLSRTHYLGYITGTIIGSLPMIPWFFIVIPNLSIYQEFVDENNSLNLFPRFYLQWLTSALGVNLSNTLRGIFWTDFLAEPRILGWPTYLMIPAHTFLSLVGLYPAYRWWKNRKKSPFKAVDINNTLSFYLGAFLWGTGGLFTLLRVNVHSHYMAVIFPFQYLWLSQLYKNKFKILLAIILTQMLISMTFLNFIHRTGGFPFNESDYGITYRVQQLQSP